MKYLRDDPNLVITSCPEDEEPLQFTDEDGFCFCTKCKATYRIKDLFNIVRAKRLNRMPAGRPTDYTPELANDICEKISLGKSLVEICWSDGMPNMSTIYRWLAKGEALQQDDKNHELAIFCNMYAKARENQADTNADEINHIADNCNLDPNSIAKARLQIDARKWTSAKLKPRKYGDRIETALTDHEGNALTIQLVQFSEKKEENK